MTDTIANHPVVLSMIVALPLFGALARIFGVSFRRVAKWYLYVAIFAVTIVMTDMFFPFIGGKDYFFRVSVELSLVFFLLSWAFEMKNGELKALLKETFKRPLAIAMSAFAGVFLLACAFAYDSYAAFWSNYERGEGGFQMIHYYLFFILAVMLLKTEKDWRNMFKFSLGAAALMVLYGVGGSLVLPGFIGPWAGSAAIPAGWVQKFLQNRFQGSLGNAEYVGAYLLFTMFFAAWLWVRQDRKTKEAGKKLGAGVHAGYVAVMLFFLLFFLLSQTRGALLGLGLAILAMVAYWAVAGRGKFRKWSTLGVIIVLAIGLGIWSVRNTSFVENLPGGRLLQISLHASDVNTRFMVWGEAWQGFLERPITGWGPENFTTVYDKFFNPGFYDPLNPGGSQTWFDRAHSVYFDYLVETGIIGLVAFASIFAAFFVEFRRRRHQGQPEGHSGSHLHAKSVVIERGLILAVPVAYLVQGAALFDVLPIYVGLYTFLAFSHWYFYERKETAIHHENHG